MHTFWVTFFVILVLPVPQRKQVLSAVIFKTAECTFNTSYLHNCSMLVNKSKLTFLFHNKVPIVPGFMARVEFKLYNYKTKAYNLVFQHTMDFCRMTKSERTNLVKGWYMSIVKQSNFKPSCPLPPTPYLINNWEYPTSKTPSMLFASNSQATVYSYYGTYKTKSERFVSSFVMDVLTGQPNT